MQTDSSVTVTETAVDPLRTISADAMIEAERTQIAERRQALGIPVESKEPKLLGVAFSGGGIRSATFNLGIAQALADLGLLPHVDYLSTVSGGGYIGTWLHSVIRRSGGNPRSAVPLLRPPERKPHERENPAEDPVGFLRKYSSYLAPEMSLLSADFWSILAIWLRNTLLNQLIIVPLLAVVGLLAFTVGLLWSGVEPWQPHLTIVAVVFLAVGAVLTGRSLNRVVVAAQSPEDTVTEGPPDRTLTAAVTSAMFFLAASILALSYKNIHFDKDLIFIGIALFVCFAAFQSFGGFYRCCRQMAPPWSGGVIIFAIIACAAGAASVTALLLWLSAAWMQSWGAVPDQGSWLVLAWGPPLMSVALLFGAAIHVGLMGVNYPDYAREWMARIAAFICIGGFVWAGCFTLCVFGPYWLALLAVTYGKTALASLSAWAGTTAAGVLAGKSAHTGGKSDDRASSRRISPMEWIGKLAPAVFFVGFMVLLSLGAFSAIRAVTYPNPSPIPPVTAATPGSMTVSLQAANMAGSRVNVKVGDRSQPFPGLAWLVPIEQDYWKVLDRRTTPSALLACLAGLAGCAFLAWLLQWRIDINEFSLHHFYKNRLVRCYLGASHGRTRKASALTGFDPRDDFPISKLLPGEGYFGPYPIINGTVNLNRGSELAKQERQGESFIFTPLACGFDTPVSKADRQEVRESVLGRYGYCPTLEFTYRDGPAIGTCMAISGAAANPNHGYHTSAALAFLLTVFDVRLGWWVGNPRRPNRRLKPGPTQSLVPLLSELFAQTNQSASWLNISDGGHFENLGLYELVRRRCAYIIIGDGEQDGALTFNSLGGAIRKCRTDFGADIEIDPRRIHAEPGSLSETHCVVGSVLYDDGAKGTILYLKSSLTGDEPEDVAQYAAANSAFPHQSTANQFFTESQFESYRKLGWHVAQSAFANILMDSRVTNRPPLDLRATFAALEQQWYAPGQIADGAIARLADSYSRLMHRVANEAELAALGPQLFDWTTRPVTEQVSGIYDINREADRKIYFFCLELIQLMENVWLELHFYQASERESPRHSGWMNVFARWATQPAMKWAWKLSADTYNPLFQQFMTSLQEPPEAKGKTA